MRTFKALFSALLALGFVSGPMAVAPLAGAAVLGAEVILESDFGDGTTQGWSARETEGDGTEVTAVTIESLDAAAPSGVVENHPVGVTYAIAVTGRDNQGDGAIFDVRDKLVGGEKYEFSAYALFLDGNRGALTLSSQTDGDTFTNLIEFPDISFGEWTHLTGTFTMPLFDDVAYLYLETPWQGGAAGNTDSFALANITLSTPDNIAEVGDLPALKDTMPNMNTGMAIDARETTGPASRLVLQQFNQVVAENHMKPEAWFDGQWNFERIGEGSENMRLHPQARAILQFAADNDLDVFGHVLIWHSQIPDWFFQDANGAWLTGESGREELLRRMDNYIYNVAKLITDEFGPFGSATNPMTAYEVVNEVISNSNIDAFGLRPSRWMTIIGDDFVDNAFIKADQYFNHEFAEPGSDRPIQLWINDYNTEITAKRERYIEVVNRLLERGVPIDGAAHQFHLMMSTPMWNVEQALDDFTTQLPTLKQAVTELDVTLGRANPDEAQLEAQGHRYLELFNLFREHQEEHNDLAFVTVWGLTDARSWRGDLAPVLFHGNLDPKPAFWGAVGDLAQLGVLRGEGFAFGGGFNLAGATNPASFDDVAWLNTPPLELSDGAGDFRVRWSPEGAVVLANLTADADRLLANFNGQSITVDYRNLDQLVINPISDDVSALARTNADGSHQVLLFLADNTLVDGGTAELDVRARSGNTDLGGWNSEGTLGQITFVEPLSFTEAVEANRAPVFGVDADSIWNDGVAIHTDLTQSGAADGATAIVHTLWHDDTLYVRFDVTDPVIDTTASDPWEQDSVEVFLDLGNAKNGPYRPWHDIQVRVSADGLVTFGEGEPGRMNDRLVDTFVERTDTGYVVELAIGLWTINEHQSRVDYGGVDTFQGFDVQVNDASGGVRTAVHSWANPTDQGFQDTSRWGVIELVNEPRAAAPGMPTAPGVPAAGGENAGLPLLPFLIGIPLISALAIAWWATRRKFHSNLPEEDIPAVEPVETPDGRS